LKDEREKNISDYSVFKQIRFLLHSQPQNKSLINRARIIMLFFSNVIIIPLSMFSGGFNPIYFFLNALKIILIFSVFFSFFYLVIGNLDSAKLWLNKSTRKKEILGRILHVVKESIILFGVSSGIFALFHISGFPKQLETSFIDENPTLAFPLSYSPTLLELFLLLAIFVSLLLTFFTFSYWLYSRCAQYTGYNEQKKILKFNLKRILIGFAINAFIFSTILAFFFDEFFIATKFPMILARWSKYETIFSSNAYIILVLELVIIVVLNIFYIIDGLIANCRRQNFLNLELIDVCSEFS